MPCCLVDPQFLKHLLHLLLKNFCCKQLSCLENSHLLFTFARLSVKELIKVFLCLSAIEFFQSSHFCSLSDSLPLAIFPSLPLLHSAHTLLSLLLCPIMSGKPQKKYILLHPISFLYPLSALSYSSARD